MESNNIISTETDVVLIGAGIMSATLGVLLKELQPDLRIQIFERLDVVAGESSNAWNNAGTGHSAYCELNYTPKKGDGTIDTSKALKIAESFEVSLQFWAYLREKNLINSSDSFIKRVPHLSFVWGQENVDFLKKRYEALKTFPLFEEMQYSESFQEIKNWIPLVMEGRYPMDKVAATKMDIGTDVNFEMLTKQLLAYLKSLPGVEIHLKHEVNKIRKKDGSLWKIKVNDLSKGEKRKLKARFVFIGAGGGALPLLLSTKVMEGKGFAGFPVSGQWLRCKNPEIIAKHGAKVYGRAAVGSPPMSVPHLDTRVINGKKELLFGPYAGFSTKFLKNGSYLDLPLSIKMNNLRPLIAAGIDNIPLTKYLIHQVRQSQEDRFEALKEYFPNAKMEDWELEVAGQRVQVIKKDPEHGGRLEFGTEIVASEDGSLTALLGASPGASTSVATMLELLKKCFDKQFNSREWQQKLKEMIPSFGHSLVENPELLNKVRKWSHSALGMEIEKPELQKVS